MNGKAAVCGFLHTCFGEDVMMLRDLQDTRHLADELVSRLYPGAVVCLVGDLGAGKTTLTQAICEALGVDAYVTSPTFALVNVYEGVLGGAPLEVYHFDVYRLESPLELEDIGFDDMIFGTGISIIEWADRVEALIPETALWVTLGFDASGQRYAEIGSDGFSASPVSPVSPL